MALLQTGDKAPDVSFTLPDRTVVPLSSYRGKNVVIAFYPRAFTGG